jgi:hypothetical protein
MKREDEQEEGSMAEVYGLNDRPKCHTALPCAGCAFEKRGSGYCPGCTRNPYHVDRWTANVEISSSTTSECEISGAVPT